MFSGFKLILSIMLLLLTSSAAANNYTSPDNIKGSTRINAETLINLARNNEELVIIDSRIQSDRRQGYISGSISLPDTQTSCHSLHSTLEKKDKPVVFYCNGPKCRRSDRSVQIAIDCGYSNIFWFRGGYEEWQNKHYLISK